MVSRAGSVAAAGLAAPAAPAAAPATQRSALRPVVGVLPDGTAFYAPIGEVVVDGPRVTCHLCGRSLRSVAAHLAAHGWTKEQYCEAFGLERGQSLEGAETRKLRAAALSARLVFDPAIRAGSAAGRERARRGELTRDAAQAARGRSFPEQRRRKAARAFARGPVAAGAGRASRERADQYLAGVAADAARRLGYPDLGTLVLARTGRGPAWPRSAARPGCTRTGCPATWSGWPPARPRPSGATAEAGTMCPGARRSAVSDSPMWPATCATGTRSGTGRSTPSPPRSGCPITLWSPPCAGTG